MYKVFTKTSLVVAACGLLAFPVYAQDSETVVATVDGTEITLGHVVALRKRLPENYQALEDDVLLKGLVDQLVQQEMLTQEVDETEKEIALSLENEKRGLLAGVAIDRIQEAALTDEAIQALYDETFANAEKEVEMNASHILVETEEEANAIVQQLTDGADFAELAKEKSTGPSGPNGGQLGWFGKGMMVPEFEAASLGLEVGEVSTPVQTQFGWHVIKMNELRDKPAPAIDTVRDQLVDQLRSQAIQDKINALEAKATIVLVEDIDASLIRNDSLLD